MASNRANGVPPPVRVFVGTSPGGADAEAQLVCEYGLNLRSSAPVEIEWMALSRDPRSPYYSDPGPAPPGAVDERGHPPLPRTAGWQTERWSTPWTALRWAVPALCGWRGRAVYFDCSTVVLGDVAALAAAPMPEGACVLLRRDGAKMRLGCVVFDCVAAERWLPGLEALQRDVGAHQTVGRLLSTHPALVGGLPAGWGCRDQDYSRDPASVTGSLHCAATAIQPHLPRAAGRLARARREHWFKSSPLPHYCPGLVALWEAEYAAALAAGYEVDQYVPGEGAAPAAGLGTGDASWQR